MQGQIFIFSAPSGTGKSTIITNVLDQLPGCQLSISYTTRRPRSHESDGKEYFFISKEKFEAMIKNDEFLEHAVVFGNYYGTHRGQVQNVQTQGMDVLLDIDVQGAQQVRRKVSGVVSVFILPPSIEVLQQRLEARRTETSEDLRKRLQQAKVEIKECAHYDYLVLNDNIAHASECVRGIIQSERLRTARALPELKARITL